MEIVPNDSAGAGYRGSYSSAHVELQVNELQARLELTDIKDRGSEPKFYAEGISASTVLIRPIGCKFRSVQMRDRAEAVDFKKYGTYACSFEREGMVYRFMNEPVD